MNSICQCALKRLESINRRVYNPNILFDCGKPFVFGRQDTLQLIDYTRFTANMLSVHDWDKNTNDNYIKCAIDNLGNGGTIYIYFRNESSSDKMAEVFEKDLTRVREGQTSSETPEFVYELGQLLITSKLQLSEKNTQDGYTKYRVVRGAVDEHETALLINVVRGILSKQTGARKQIKLLGKTRNIYYTRAKNGRLIEMVTYKGELVPLKALKVIA